MKPLDIENSPSPNSIPSEDQEKNRADAKQRLASKFGIDAEFLRVPMLSKMLSISANAIYAQMSSGTFPVAHKKVGNVVLVRFDDFINWYCTDGVSGGHAPTRRKPASQPACVESASVWGQPPVSIDSDVEARLENRKERALRIKFEALAAIKPK
jgi:predicted DNA-binding transcriptional regulator AlpA